MQLGCLIKKTNESSFARFTQCLAQGIWFQAPANYVAAKNLHSTLQSAGKEAHYLSVVSSSSASFILFFHRLLHPSSERYPV